MDKFQTLILTVSDRTHRGERDDVSGPTIAGMLSEDDYRVVRRDVVPDDFDVILDALRGAEIEELDLVLTTGGTGFAPRDVTPEATLAVIDRRADGLSEAMRAASRAHTPFAMLSRAVCGMAGGTLIVNLPGSPKAVLECLDVILPVLPHGLRLLKGERRAQDEH